MTLWNGMMSAVAMFLIRSAGSTLCFLRERSPMTSLNFHLAVPKTTERRLPSSTDGRFTIIDEKNKESDGFDETSSSSDNDNNDTVQFSKSCYISKCSSPNLPHLNYSVSQPSRMSASAAASHTAPGNSRFKIVPVESRYKRGRWETFDYYEHEQQDLKRSALSASTPNRGAACWNGTETVLQLNTSPKRAPMSQPGGNRAPLATPEPMSSRSLASDLEDSDRENSVPLKTPERHAIPSTEETNAAVRAANPSSGFLAGSPEFISGALSGRITPSEMLNQYGLEKSLSAAAYNTNGAVDEAAVGNAGIQPHAVNGVVSNAATVNTSASASNISSAHIANNNGINNVTPQQANIVAIDSKIEQAMDLVKTHLMFAVREEVESLRSRIMELETTVVHLEAENSILREHVPNDVLQSLSFQSGQSALQAGRIGG